MKNKLENWHRVKWLYDGCASIDEMLERLSEEVTRLEDMQESGAKVDRPSKDDYTHITATVEEGSEEEHNLCNMAFEIERQE
jgi:hypothetical protein